MYIFILVCILYHFGILYDVFKILLQLIPIFVLVKIKAVISDKTDGFRQLIVCLVCQYIMC